MFVRDTVSLFTSLYKNIANDLAILRVLLAQWIEHPHGRRKAVGSTLFESSEFLFFWGLLVCKKKTEVSIYSYKPVPKVVVFEYCTDPYNDRLGRRYLKTSRVSVSWRQLQPVHKFI